ncbi:myelin-oligodendrocyte glycoprotein-like [Pelmatolapia mariae]|uniref:myelin-oligodendrocyte glycoprotein-like n=1 Tax=Pelmatolapia mariae TaxID=158779 RepID=UPI002FE5BEC9
MKLRLLFVVLLHVSQHASGVKVYEGVKSVLLPCQVPADVSRSSTAVVWDYDEFDNPTVHVRLQSGDGLRGQNNRYTNRTSMRADALQTGDLSLTLRNPTFSDSGNYTCIIKKNKQQLSRTKVQLRVKEPPLWPWVLAVTLLILVLVIVAFGVILYCERKRFKAVEAQLLSERLLRRLHVLFGKR